MGFIAFSGTLKNPRQSIIIREQAEPRKDKNKKINSTEEPRLEVKTFKNDFGWGYDIYLEGKLYIHQPYIPAISGNEPFRSEEDARKTGQLIIAKIRKNILPPSVAITELDSIGIFIPTYQR